MSNFRSALLFAAICTSFGSAVAHADNETLNYNVINIQADASRQVSNDEMNAVLFIEKSQKNPAELAQIITRAMNQAMSVAKRYPSVKVETGAQSSYPVYDNTTQKLKEWRSRAELNIKSTDFKAASQLIADLQQTFQTESIQFSVSDAQRKQVENSLFLEASKNFQARAQSLTQAWNKSQYQLVNLNFNTNNYTPQPYARAVMAKMSLEAADAPQEVSAGESKITVNANGSIQLK